MSATLRIEHQITDFETWKGAFDRFADARARGGVTSHRIRLHEEDAHLIDIDLEFPDARLAHAFASFLHETVWATPSSSPALVGAPTTRVLLDAPC